MSVTGIALVLFLTFHMAMNLVAIISADGYNMICEFLNRAKAARRAALGGGGSAAGESFYPWSFVVIFGKMFGNRWKTIPAPEKLFKKSRISS